MRGTLQPYIVWFITASRCWLLSSRCH